MESSLYGLRAVVVQSNYHIEDILIREEINPMYRINNFFNNDDIKVIGELGPFRVIEYQRDLSVMPGEAALAYFCNEMNVRKRQVICDLSQASGITVQAGAMQWMVGRVNATTGLKGVR